MITYELRNAREPASIGSSFTTKGIISEHTVAMETVKKTLQLVTQLVAQIRSLSWLSHCKREKVDVARCEVVFWGVV